jgi:hypothetical protein
MQERRRGAVLRALVPLGAGHALAVAAAVIIAAAVGAVIPIGWLRWPVAGVLVIARRTPVRSSPAPAMGEHAREHRRPDAVVIPDGHRRTAPG